MREQHLSQRLIYEFVVLVGRKLHVPERKALHLTAPLVRRLERHQRGAAGIHRMSQLLRHPVSVPCRARAGIRQPARGYDGVSAVDLAAFCLHGPYSARLVREDALCLLPYYPDAVFPYKFRQCVRDVVRAIRHGENTVAPLCLRCV